MIFLLVSHNFKSSCSFLKAFMLPLFAHLYLLHFFIYKQPFCFAKQLSLCSCISFCKNCHAFPLHLNFLARTCFSPAFISGPTLCQTTCWWHCWHLFPLWFPLSSLVLTSILLLYVSLCFPNRHCFSFGISLSNLAWLFTLLHTSLSSSLSAPFPSFRFSLPLLAISLVIISSLWLVLKSAVFSRVDFVQNIFLNVF